MFFWKDLNFFSLSLWPLAWFFCVLSKLRYFLYQNGFWTSHQFDTPIIIVGNISVGGTGKTPFLIYLAQYLQNSGYNVGIISRGYGGQHRDLKQGKSLLVNDLLSAYEVGDEPQLIYQRTRTAVVVGKNRAQSVKLLEKINVDIIVSDDGLQHYALQRDLEICIIDESTMFQNGLCLPAGPLREKPTRLQTVDFVLFNRSNKAYAQQHHDSQLMKISIRHCYQLKKENNKVDIEHFYHQKVHAVAGIGNPVRFFNQLKQLGLLIIEHPYADHYVYQDTDLDYKDDLMILMTEKDAVKCIGFDNPHIWVVPLEVEVTESWMNRLENRISQLNKGRKQLWISNY